MFSHWRTRIITRLLRIGAVLLVVALLATTVLAPVVDAAPGFSVSFVVQRVDPSGATIRATITGTTPPTNISTVVLNLADVQTGGRTGATARKLPMQAAIINKVTTTTVEHKTPVLGLRNTTIQDLADYLRMNGRGVEADNLISTYGAAATLQSQRSDIDIKNAVKDANPGRRAIRTASDKMPNNITDVISYNTRQVVKENKTLLSKAVSGAQQFSTALAPQVTTVLDIQVAVPKSGQRTSGVVALLIDGQYYYDLSNSSWWNALWTKRKVLSFNASTLTANVTNFPVKVVLSAANFTFADAMGNGEDMRFLDADDATALDYQIEQWDVPGQSAILWVRVPQINGPSTNTDYIHMYYGNAAAVDAQNPNGVWSNVTSAWLFNDDVGANAADSAVAGNNGTLAAGATWSSTGVHFDGGVTGYVDMGAIFHAQAKLWTVIQLSFDVVYGPGSADMLAQFKFIDGNNFAAVSFRGTSDAGTGSLKSAKFTGGVTDFEIFSVQTNWAATPTQHTLISSTSNATGSRLIVNNSAAVVGANPNPQPNGGNLRIGGTSIGDPGLIGVVENVFAGTTDLSASEETAWYLSLSNTLLYYGSTYPQPTTTTQAATGVTMNAAGVTGGTFNGTLATLGGASTATAWFQYGLTVAYGTETAHVATVLGAYTAAIPAGLTPGQTYHYRAAAANAIGTDTALYGADQTFTFTMPTVTAGASTLAGATVTLSGNVTNMGAASTTSVYFQYGPTTSYGSSTPLTTQAGIGAFSASVAAPNSNTTLFYRAIAQNGSVASVSTGSSLTIPSAAGGALLRGLLRVLLAAIVLVGVLLISTREDSTGFSLITAAVIGLVCFAIVDSIISSMFS